MTAGMLGDPMRLVGRALIADDDVADHAFDRAADQRSERAGKTLFVIAGFDENAEHFSRIAESAAMRQLRAPGEKVLDLFSPAK